MLDSSTERQSQLEAKATMRDRILGYIKRGEKIKLCILDLFLKKEFIGEYELRELLSTYYPVRIYNTSAVYNELRNEGMIVYDTEKGREKLSFSREVNESFKELAPLISPFLIKEVWGRRDVVRTLEERHAYLVQKILARGGIAAQKDLVADLSRDANAGRLHPFYRSREFDDSLRNINNDIEDLVKSGYVVKTPVGYRIPDFVMYDFLSDTTRAMEILSNLSADLWMGFEFQRYLSTVGQLGQKCDKVKKFVLDSAAQLEGDQLNDALDSLNTVCDELSAIIYNKIIGEGVPPRKLHARLVEIGKKQHIPVDDPEGEEVGKNAAVFLSSLLYVAKWMRDKSSHPLIKPTRDAVRLALASVLISIDVSRTLKILE